MHLNVTYFIILLSNADDFANFQKKNDGTTYFVRTTR